MNSLRFLLVHRNPKQSEEIAARLADANHTVLPTSGLEEAVDALTVERFDAILMESAFPSSGSQNFGLQDFSAQLRRMEQSQRSNTRVPVIAISGGPLNGLESWVDAVVPEPLDPHALTAAVSRLADAVSSRATVSDYANSPALVVLDPEKFREQVGFDNELMLEIIDLFLEERQKQEPQMRQAFESGDFDQLSRVAHTIKGSLGSLHAQRARVHAEDLEMAARHQDRENCGNFLSGLLHDLAELEPELLALKHVSA